MIARFALALALICALLFGGPQTVAACQQTKTLCSAPCCHADATACCKNDGGSPAQPPATLDGSRSQSLAPALILTPANLLVFAPPIRPLARFVGRVAELSAHQPPPLARSCIFLI